MALYARHFGLAHRRVNILEDHDGLASSKLASCHGAASTERRRCPASIVNRRT
jgi:hypothetical protein